MYNIDYEMIEQRIIQVYGQKIKEVIEKEVKKQIEEQEFNIFKEFLKTKMEANLENKNGGKQ